MKNLIFIALLLSFSCNKKQEENRHIDIYYLGKNISYTFNIPCHMIQQPSLPGVKYVTINDKEFMENFNLHFNTLKEPKEIYPLDARIKIIYYHNTQIDTICMGEYFSISVNGKPKQDSPQLLKLIKDKIYN